MIEVIEAFGLLIKCLIAINNSITLCDGILVAIPTAIPLAPLASKLGNKAGSTIGSSYSPSYVLTKSTVFLSISFRSNSAISVNRASV